MTRAAYQERRIYHWHEELDRRIGVEQVPPALRAAPRVLAGVMATGSSRTLQADFEQR